jgi:RND family efflux transporter MFP subunit
MLKISIILSSAALLLASCDHKSREDNPADSKKAVTFQAMTLHKSQLKGQVKLPGVMQPFQFVQLYPRVNGFVKQVLVDRGSIVHHGQVLITLEAPEIEQEVAAARLKYTQAEENYKTSTDRYQRLLETSQTPGTVSAYDLKAAQDKMQGDSATVQGEIASYKALVTMKSYLVVTAPFDGVITERNLHPGALVGPNAQNSRPMLILQEQAKLRLEVDVPEQYTVQVSDGDEVHFHANALPGYEFTGKIKILLDLNEKS